MSKDTSILFKKLHILTIFLTLVKKLREDKNKKMFGKKNDTKKIQEKPNPFSTPNTKADEIAFDIETFPLHTMKKDLEGVVPNEEKSYAKVQDTQIKVKPNPFSATPPNRAALDKSLGDLSQKNNFPQKKVAGVIKLETTTTKNFLIPIIIFILLVVMAGGYYFWATRIQNLSNPLTPWVTPNNKNNNISSSTETTPSTENQPQKDNFSTMQANYLSLNFQDTTTEGLRTILKSYADKVIQNKTTGIIEFLVTDSLNNPVSFQDFSQKLGLTLPQSILSQLNDSFSLYISADNLQPHIGLAISQKNSSFLEKALTTEEKRLPQDLDPLFLTIPHTLANVNTFSSSIYGTSGIRYTNIISPEQLSLDYTVSDKQFMIGTSKMTLRGIIDHANLAVTPTK